MGKVDRTPFQPNDVKTFRKEFNLNIDEFAELLGVTRQAVIFWETNERRIPETTVRTLLLFRKHPDLITEF